MSKHQHNDCEHDMGYCKVCDTAYCRKCDREWFKQNFWYTGTTTGTGISYLNSTPTITCGSVSAAPGGAGEVHAHEMAQ